MHLSCRQLVAVAFLWGAAAGVCPAAGDPTGRLHGTIVGVVSDASGSGQLGATVYLFNRFEKLVQKVLTNEKGAFGFDFLPPDSYSVRVVLPSFLPAVRQNILIQPGMRSFLAINLASLMSSVELVYSAQSPTNLMTDDWKWVLRSSMSTRPVLRFLPEQDRHSTTVFGDTRGVVRVQAGDSGNGVFGGQPDLGTAFAVATSVMQKHELQVTGNVGIASRGGMPAASLRTRLSRSVDNAAWNGGSSPEVMLTVRQLFMAGHGSQAPPVRTLSTAAVDRISFGNRLDVLYGAQLESVTFYDRLNVMSPFARLTYKISSRDDVQAAFSSGAPPEEIFRSQGGANESQLGQDVGTVSAFPRVSLRDGRVHVQRTGNVELAYRRKLGRDTEVTAAVFEERVANGTMLALGATEMLDRAEVLPDPFSNGAVLNVGSYQRRGAMLSATQQWSTNWSSSVAVGNAGTLDANASAMLVASAGDVRRVLRQVQRNWIAVRTAGVAPGTSTRFVVSYLHTDGESSLPMHRYLTQAFSPELGLNIQVRQPLPGLGLWSGRLEAIVELRNALSNGYQRLEGPQGRGVLLMPTPRALRGGLAFIF
jgi:hypothetical protein